MRTYQVLRDVRVSDDIILTRDDIYDLLHAFAEKRDITLTDLEDVQLGGVLRIALDNPDTDVGSRLVKLMMPSSESQESTFRVRIH